MPESTDPTSDGRAVVEVAYFLRSGGGSGVTVNRANTPSAAPPMTDPADDDIEDVQSWLHERAEESAGEDAAMFSHILTVLQAALAADDTTRTERLVLRARIEEIEAVCGQLFPHRWDDVIAWIQARVDGYRAALAEPSDDTTPETDHG